MRTGDVILIRGRKALPKIIQWFQKLIYSDGWQWNHAGLILNIENDVFVCEATEKGIVITPFEKFICKDYIIGYPIQIIPEETLSDIVKFCLPYAGNVHYDFVNLLIEQPIKILSKEVFGREIWIGAKTEKKATKQFICGEWVAFVYNKFFACFPEYPKISPAEIYISNIFNWKNK